MDPAKQIKSLFRKTFQLDPERMNLLPASGSNRVNARIHFYGQTYIGTYGIDVAENETFIYLDDHFRAVSLPVPRILAISRDRKCYIQSDSGLDDLFHRLISIDPAGSQRQMLITLLEKALQTLIEFQIRGETNLDYSKCYPTPSFGKNEALADLKYFEAYFLIPAEIAFDQVKLDEDFKAVAVAVDSSIFLSFMHRDYQSRNIILNDGAMTVIDFQGGRKGPGLYDCISLVYQSRLSLPKEIKDHLVAYYCDRINEYFRGAPLNFSSEIPLIRLLRLLQVLGAYGWRGILEQKPHFIHSLEPAIDNLAELLDEYPDFFQRHPYLGKILHKITAQKQNILCKLKN